MKGLLFLLTKLTVVSFQVLKPGQLTALHSIRALRVQDSWYIYVSLIGPHSHSQFDFLCDVNLSS